jgi:Na+-transporting NADH:ubiquinone oxidoreductase subunit NqrD
MVLGSFLVSLSSQLAILSNLLSRSPSVCQVILEYLYSLSPALALYQVLVILHCLLDHLCRRASLGKI